VPVQTVTYAQLGALLTISSNAARSFERQHRLSRSLSDDGKVGARVDHAEVRHTPQRCRLGESNGRGIARRPGGSKRARPVSAPILSANGARRWLMTEQATEETTAAREVAARLER
jgi:hypothetical protein